MNQYLNKNETKEKGHSSDGETKTTLEKLDQISNENERLATPETRHSSDEETTSITLTSEVTTITPVFTKPERLFIIIPFRDREAHKEVFISEMNTYLTKQAKSVIWPSISSEGP